MTTTRSRASKARRVTRSIATPNSERPDTSNNINSAQLISKKIIPVTKTVAKNKLVLTNTQQMTTRSMTRPKALRVKWNKNGQKIEEPSRNTGPTSSVNQSGAPVSRSISEKKNTTSASSKRAQVTTRSMAKAVDSANKITHPHTTRVKRTNGRLTKATTHLAPSR
jgi:hypothetical protein